MLENKDAKTTNQRVFVGQVISNKMDKTIVIKVERTLKHPLIGKTVSRSKKYKVHDEQNEGQIGDWVEVIECKPYSKTKHMVLSRVLRRSGGSL